MKKICQYVLLITIVLVFLGTVFLIKLNCSPRVSVLKESPYSWENVVQTGLLFFFAVVVVILLKELIGKKYGENEENGSPPNK